MGSQVLAGGSEIGLPGKREREPGGRLLIGATFFIDRGSGRA
jgi:hypothetical protein